MKSSHTGNDKTFNTLLQWILIMLLPLLYMIITGTLPTVNATSDDSVSCYELGIIDGENHHLIKEYTIPVEISTVLSRFY